MKKKKLWLVLDVSLIIMLIVLAVTGFFVIRDKNNDENIVVTDIDIKKNEKIINENCLKEVEKSIISYEAAIPIFMYHWVRDEIGDYPWPENMMSPSKLEEQVKYLVENDYDLIWIKDLADVYVYDKPVSLTFDDGWLDVYLYMFPLAKQYNIKFTMFIITGRIGENGYCTQEQLKEMQDSGLVELECHTVNHPYLGNSTYAVQESELFDSKTALKEKFNIDSKVICYPYGSRNANTLEIANKAGFKYGLDMDGGVYYTNVHTDLLRIPRIYANRSMSMDTFISYASSSKVDAIWE